MYRRAIKEQGLTHIGLFDMGGDVSALSTQSSILPAEDEITVSVTKALLELDWGTSNSGIVSH